MSEVLGYCSKCGARGVTRDKNRTKCERGHQYENWGWDKAQQQGAETKCKGWATPYGFVDFTKPVTYAEATEQAKHIFDQCWSDENNNKEN